MKKNNKYKSKLAILYLIIYAVILSYFYYVKYIDFAVIRTMYMPIIGVSILAILLDYVLFGQVFLIASLLGLIAEYTVHIKQGLEPNLVGTFTNNTIIMLGFIVGFVIQMYMKTKEKSKWLLIAYSKHPIANTYMSLNVNRLRGVWLYFFS